MAGIEKERSFTSDSSLVPISRAYLLPWTGSPFGPVTCAASGPLAPWITINSTSSPSPTLRKYLRGLFLIMAV